VAFAENIHVKDKITGTIYISISDVGVVAALYKQVLHNNTGRF
jgi:hypothetical protein